jgi:hypothetical protein
MAEFSDWFMPLLGFITSAFAAYKFKLRGLFVGIILFWLSMVLRLEALMYFDSSYSPGILGAASNIFGWVLGLGWCIMFYIASLVVQHKKHSESVV